MDSKSSAVDPALTDSSAFSSVLIDAICESLKDTLGPDVLEILVSKGLLDDSEHPQEFHRKLASVFGNGATVLERAITKELFRRLGLPPIKNLPFDFFESVTTAKEAVSLLVRR